MAGAGAAAGRLITAAELYPELAPDGAQLAAAPGLAAAGEVTAQEVLLPG